MSTRFRDSLFNGGIFLTGCFMKVVSSASDADVSSAVQEGKRVPDRSFVNSLRETVDAEWSRIKSGEFWQRVMGAPVTPALWRDLMLQVY
ncbi:MAG: hypothetical protein ABIO61_05100, partial [Thermomonas sp.]